MNLEREYRPTPEDIERIKPQPDKLKVSGDGVFVTLQGEGVTAGLPAVFLRLHYCNLTCGYPTGWKCDTWYTWDKRTEEYWREPEDWGHEDLAIKISKTWLERFDKKEEKRLVITGGEPMLQQTKIAKLLESLEDWNIEIETNGTITPLPELHECQFNCSPKLKSSGNNLASRYKPESLRAIDSLDNSWFKFVAVTVSDLAEVEQIVSECNLKPESILIMPEGQTAEIVQEHADILSVEIEQRGWKITMRQQLNWFGNNRKT